MSDPQDLGKVTRWVEGGAVATLICMATAGIPVVMLLASEYWWRGYAAAVISGFFILLARAVELRSHRRAAPQGMDLTPAVLEAAHERFEAPADRQSSHGPADGVTQAVPPTGQCRGASTVPDGLQVIE
jgi:hypothetical protein